MDETLPQKWINRQGFGLSQKILILIWLMLASNILTWSYKSTLLSTLISISYENPIDTLSDVDRSDVPVMVPKSTVVHWLLATDPRATAKRIFNKAELYAYNGTRPLWLDKRFMLLKCFILQEGTFCQ